MKNKRLFCILISIPVLFACGESVSSSIVPSAPTSSSIPTTVVPSTTVAPTTIADPLGELYNRIDKCVKEDNYSIKYTLNEVDVVRKYLPNAVYDFKEGSGYAEDDTGIFGYSIFQKYVVADKEYLKDDAGEVLKGLYTVEVETVTDERSFVGKLVNSLDHINYSKIKSLKESDTKGLYRISYNYIAKILPTSPDTDMFESGATNVSCKIGLTDGGFRIIYTNRYALDKSLQLDVYDIGTTEINQITTYLSEGKGPGDSGSLEDYSKVHKAISLINKGNYKITASNGEVRYITRNYNLYERDVEGGKYSHGYVNIPAENNLSLEAGCYAYEIVDGAITITETESVVHSVYQTPICLSSSVLSCFVEDENGNVQTGSGYNLYSISNYFSESIVEDGSYVRSASLEIVYENEIPSIKIVCDVYNDTTLTESELTLVIDSFGNTSVDTLENYLLSLI